MKKKLLGTYVLVIGITLIVATIFSWHSIYNNFLTRIQNESLVQMKLLVSLIDVDSEEGTVDIQEFVKTYGEKTKLRITIIDDKGVVLGDSEHDVATMDNHSYREEFASALSGTPKSVLRYSSTMKSYFYYYAVPLKLDNFDGALRIAIPVKEVEKSIWDMINAILIGVFVGLVVAIGMAYIFTKRFMDPIETLTKTTKKISEGHFEEKIFIHREDEIGELAEAFNQMTFNMNKNRWKLEQKNAELEAVLTSMTTGLAAIDESYKILLHNDPFLRILDLERTDLENKFFYEITRNTEVFEVIEKAIDLDEFTSKETVIPGENSDKIVRISATPIRSNATITQNIGVLLLVEDISQIRKLENIRRDFVSNVTHELKTPLTSIKGFVDALKTGALEDEKVSRRFLDIIDIEVERLSGLIQDILSLSEIENSVIDKNIHYVSVQDIAGAVVELLQPKAEDKNITLQLICENHIKPFQCNPDRLKQLFINLVDNGIKYTEQGKVSVVLSSDASYLIIDIMDTGIGIKKEHIPRLFERFYRVDRGRSRKMGGTGLGLSIVKHIVELYHGNIQVESEEGKGTQMRILFPFDGGK